MSEEAAAVSDPPPQLSSPWLRWVRRGLNVGGLGFMAYAAWSLSRRWDSTHLSLQWYWLALSLLPHLAGTWILAWGWHRQLLHASRQKVPLGPAMSLNLESQLARYAPGKVGVPAIRMAGAASLRLSKRLIGTTVLTETACFVALGFLVSTVWLLGHGGLGALPPALRTGTAGLAVAGSVLGTLTLLVVDRTRLPLRLQRTMGLEGRGPLIPWELPLVHAVYWATWIAHGALVGLAFGVEAAPAWRGGGFFALAPVLGFLALVAPGGIGVREAVLSFGLDPTWGVAPAVASAIASRAVSLLGDFLGYVLSLPLRK